jgi:hypothetical protein
MKLDDNDKMVVAITVVLIIMFVVVYSMIYTGC